MNIKNLENWRIKQGLKKADMARLFNVDPQKYNNWVYRESLPKDFFARAEQITKDAIANVSQLNRKPGSVPLISWVQAGEWCESPDIFSPGDAEEWLPCPSNHSSKTYALRVINDSMTSLIPGERSYPHGTIIFVDPDRSYEIGSRVIARLPNSSEATFKIYSEDAGVPYLVPINTRYPTIKIPEGTQICGVIIGAYWSEH